jgi:hypothetical protein
MKPGTKVIVLVETWMAPERATGVVHVKNLTDGFISVQYDEQFGGSIFDFDESLLEEIV